MQAAHVNWLSATKTNCDSEMFALYLLIIIIIINFIDTKYRLS